MVVELLVMGCNAVNGSAHLRSGPGRGSDGQFTGVGGIVNRKK